MNPTIADDDIPESLHFLAQFLNYVLEDPRATRDLAAGRPVSPRPAAASEPVWTLTVADGTWTLRLPGGGQASAPAPACPQEPGAGCRINASPEYLVALHRRAAEDVTTS